MYTLMNKNTPLIDFHWEPNEIVGRTLKVLRVYQQPWFIKDLSEWITKRSITRNRRHMHKLQETLGLISTESLITFSKGLSLTDTLWININDTRVWGELNLFKNEFDSVIERIALDGGNWGQVFFTPSPEFSTNGTYAKCWHREADGQIYLYKQGSEGSAYAGNEVYSELYASQMLEKLGYPHAKYDVIEYQSKIVSRCPLLTSETEMLLPITSLIQEEGFRIEKLIAACEENGMQTQLAETMLLDALILNEDRHTGNIGIVCDADTFEIKGMAPIYDNGVSLLCNYHVDPRYPKRNPGTMLEYASERTPRLYSDFVRGAKALASKQQLDDLQKLRGFKFDANGPFNLSSERRRGLEAVVQNQLELLTRDESEYEETTQFKIEPRE